MPSIYINKFAERIIGMFDVYTYVYIFIYFIHIKIYIAI